MIKLDKLLKLSADFICTIDGQGRFVDVSEASLDLLGYTPEELCGRSYTDFIDSADLGIAAEALVEVISGAKLQIQNRYVHKDGHIVPLRWSAQWDVEDQLLYAIARSGLITEREEAMRISLEESNQRYQYVSRATSDAIWDWDIVKGTLYWGENFETIFGYKQAEISPGIESWTSHICPDDIKRVTESIQVILQGKETNWKEEYRYRRADRTFADVVDRGFVIRDKEGTAVRMVGAMHDISERKLALKEMKRITDDLYKHNRELQEFGYIVSHNLRSPVANIMGIATLLEIEKDDPETVAYCTNNLKNSISRLDEVIIDLSKILNATDSSVELTMERIDLYEMIRNIKTDLADNILRNQVRIEVTQGTFLLYSHKAYIYSVFFNLITNAIKYRSESDPIITLGISYEETMIHIVLSDNGRGIDLERHSAELFKPYKRFHTDVEGKGLGMFLVKSHIDVLGGEISVTSEPGSGTTFTILLPRRSDI
ncbi:PAS domain-containing protein [Mucilaginibacter sp. ZT4R22]|uniref:histidine kinase n=1 Tax=Mucilaginibacter pankratovii TaxID=2772110 RepID=A0ABR7WQD7_9SPHI|nr:HAMP domain-containing sensor histidine kinase [Mucilaginibacter pankratovii]MBD1364525.1 PAS domain-containing protein [Mucilaginibacter pankratovii]